MRLACADVPVLELRRRVVEVAKTWLGTPFEDGCGVKGRGVDCAYLPIRVYAEAGLIDDFDPPHYSPQIMFHTNTELYVDTLLTYSREIEERDVAPGDVVLYRVGRRVGARQGFRSFNHGAIVVEWPHYTIHPIVGAGVVGLHGTAEGMLFRKARRYFSYFQ
jgi:cell wall-associated NlpC family hydrolase